MLGASLPNALLDGLAISRFLDPAFWLLVLLGAALGLGFRRTTADVDLSRRRARILAWAAWGALWVGSTPAVAALLFRLTAIPTPDLDTALAGSNPRDVAVVVLGGGAHPADPGAAPSVRPREILSGWSAMRVITAARVCRDRDVGTVIVTGSDTEAEAMSDLLVALGVPKDRIVREGRSRNTRDNASNSAKILRSRGLSVVVVVTSAVHLRRSLREFAAVGVRAIPVAADWTGVGPTSIVDFVPAAGGLASTAAALHELLGLLRPRFGGV